MMRRLSWFAAGTAAAPLAWGVAHIAYIAVDDWLTERRRLPRELIEVEDRLAALCEDAGETANALVDHDGELPADVVSRLGRDLQDAVGEATR